MLENIVKCPIIKESGKAILGSHMESDQLQNLITSRQSPMPTSSVDTHQVFMS